MNNSVAVTIGSSARRPHFCDFLDKIRTAPSGSGKFGQATNMIRNAGMLSFAAIGLISGMWSGVARADLVTNGGFEAGDFTGWNVSDPNGITIDKVTPSGGQYDASLGTASATGTLTQTLITTPGTTYTISFDLMNQDSTFAGDFLSVSFGSDVIFSSSGILPTAGYNSFVFQDMAAAGSTDIVFTAENDSSVWNLDNVSVQALPTSVPEPSSALLLAVAVYFATMIKRARR